jgi:hypothetical protein
VREYHHEAADSIGPWSYCPAVADNLTGVRLYENAHGVCLTLIIVRIETSVGLPLVGTPRHGNKRRPYSLTSIRKWYNTSERKRAAQAKRTYPQEIL